MHIPDGLLDLKTITGATMVSIPTLSLAVKKTRQRLQEKFIPLTAALAAFIFIAQMLNFPISPGTSGHLIGAFLLTLLLGPWMAMIALSLVLVVQAFLFQDGGLLTLPVNILNMAVIGCMVSAFYIRVLNGRFHKKTGWISGMLIIAGCVLAVTAMAAAGAVEFWISGLFELKVISGLLIGSHILIGLIEGVITLLIVRFVMKVRPDLFNEST